MGYSEVWREPCFWGLHISQPDSQLRDLLEGTPVRGSLDRMGTLPLHMRTH